MRREERAREEARAGEAERARESQFAVLKDAIKKLVYALDSRN